MPDPNVEEKKVICPKCETETEEGSAYCSKCGFPLYAARLDADLETVREHRKAKEKPAEEKPKKKKQSSPLAALFGGE
ncbi:MAG: zinc ribbon domain-containing protein [Patescibacteria group bacterium]|nr:zinc ribbon domain-containing protein [Patescibacteria group bacterium]